MISRSLSGRRDSSLLLCVLLALTSSVCRSGVCAPAQSAAFANHQAWSTEQGLPQASVHQIFQSNDGYLWLATEGGVARFDAVGFKSYTHETDLAFTSNDVSSIAEAPSGVLWFGTSDGLIRMDGSSVRRFTQGDGLPSSSIVSLAAAKDGSLLVLTAAGLTRFNDSRFHTPAGTLSVTSLERGRDGSVWLLGDKGPQHYKADTTSPVSRFDSVSEPILGVQTSPGGAVWLRTARTVQLTAGAFHRTLTAGQDFPGTRVEALLVDDEATAWIGTNRGLFTLTAEPSARMQRIDELRTDSILSIFQDREGNHWVGTESSGLHAFRARKFRAEPASAGDAVTAVVQAGDGTIWFGTRDEGVRSLRKNQAEALPAPAALTSPVVLSLASGPNGDLWVGTPDGLNHIQQGQVHKYTAADGLPDDFVRSVLVSRDGSVWVGTRSGLAHLSQSKISTLTQAEGLASNSIGPIYESNSESNSESGSVSDKTSGKTQNRELWVGTAAGLTRLLRDGTMRNFSRQDGLPGSIVTAITQDKGGTLWVGVHNAGLSRFTNGRFQQISAPDLPLEISAMTADSIGYLWLRGKRGVYRVPLQALARCGEASPSCRLPVGHYDALDGMPSAELTAEGSPSLLLTNSGELWSATRKGLAFAEPSKLPTNTTPPPVVMQRFLVDDVEQPLRDRIPPVASGHRSFTFDYAGLSYTMPSRTHYRYKLVGFDRDWVDAGVRRTAYYTSLPGGSYRFRVLAENNDGVWNETGADLRFSVLPPIFLRWWFYALLLLPLVAGGALASQIRLRTVRRQFALVLNERNRVAREIHDTLAQDLVSVSLQLELVSQLVRANRLTLAAEQIQEARSLVKKGLEAARQSIWNLRANVVQNSLPIRLKEIVEQFANRYPSSQVKIGGAYRQLDASTEGEVLRIVQESLLNVDRHAAATVVFVDLRYETDTLTLSVRDDGRGFVPNAARTLDGHYGLRGMEERAAALGGSLTLASNHGQGTTVTLTVPLRVSQGRQR